MTASAEAAPRYGSAGLVATVGSLAVAGAALVLSFREPFPSIEIGLHANAGRMLAAAAAGMAFAAAASCNGSGRLIREAYLFALSIGAAGGLAIGLKYFGAPASIPFGIVGGLAALGLVRWTDGGRRRGNIGLAVLFLGLFAGAVPAYLAASTEPEGMGGVALWLLGDVSRASGIGAAGAFALALGVSAWTARGVEQTGASSSSKRALLMGLGVGIAGPVAFVGGAGAALADWALGSAASGARRVAVAGLSGAALLMFADAVGRFAIGGYALPLNLTIGFVGIPVMLWANRRRLRRRAAQAPGWGFETFEWVLVVAVAAGFGWLAYTLTSFVRMAT